MHGDNFGGLVQNGKLAYHPNATVYVSQKEYDFWLDPQNLAQACPECKPAFQRGEDVFKILAAENKVKTFSVVGCPTAAWYYASICSRLYTWAYHL
ncbi:MAG: hypothetical protein ACR5LD_02770 [Symbiopectobacterium sp.]